MGPQSLRNSCQIKRLDDRLLFSTSAAVNLNSVGVQCDTQSFHTADPARVDSVVPIHSWASVI